MNCKDVFDLFEKCGGKIVCNYQSKQCVVQGTNLTCTIKSAKDSDELDWLVWKNSARTFGIDNNGIKIDNNIHRYQNSKHKGIIIDLLEK